MCGDVFCMYMCMVVARAIVCTLQLLKSRHLTHKEVFFSLKGVRIREVSMCVFVHHS